jgi:hypothetical protein
MHIGYLWESQKEDEDVGWWIIIKWIFEKWDGGDMDWIDLAQDRGQWRALVNTVMSLQLP